MLLLAIQYCIQPRVTKKYLDPRINKKSVAMVEEVAKMSLSAAIFLTNEYCRRSIGGGKSIPVGDFILSLKENLSGMFDLAFHLQMSFNTIEIMQYPDSSLIIIVFSDWTIRSSLTIAAIPSFLYAIQGVLTYTAYQNIDAVTFNGLSQTKIISAAICCFWILGKPQSLVQIGALIMLFSSALVFQGSIRILPSLLQVQRLMKTKLGNSADCQKHDADPFDIGKEQRQHRFAFGVLPCIGAAFLSGLAGSYSQKGLQQVSLTSAGGAISGRDPFLYTVEISFYSACFLLIPILFQRLRQAGKNKKTEINNEASMKSFKNGQFSFWSKKTLIPIFLKAVGGILTALVHKYAGSVLKGFSLILGLVFSGCLQCLFDAKELTLDQIFATILVMWSSWLHFTHPPLPIS